MVPPGHHESIVRALVAGFQGDMLLVAHLVELYAWLLAHGRRRPLEGVTGG